MRAFAWALVAFGLLVAIASPIWTTIEYRRLDKEMFTAAVQMQNYRYDSMARDLEALSKWPGIIAGAAMSAFGILLLAIRRPVAAGR